MVSTTLRHWQNLGTTNCIFSVSPTGAIEELFLQITQTLVGRKFDTERQRYLKQANPVLVQETPTQSSSCCGI
jgi:hypothetical protein